MTNKICEKVTLTVKELRKLLSQYDDSLKVIIGYECVCISNITKKMVYTHESKRLGERILFIDTDADNED